MTTAHANKATLTSESASEIADRCCVYHLVVLRITPTDHVLAKVLPSDRLQLPSVVLPTTPKYSEGNELDRIRAYISDQLGFNIRIVQHLWNGVYNRFHAAGETKEHRVLLLEDLDEQPVVREPFEWIPRENVFKQEWERTNDDKDDCTVSAKIELSFRELNDEDSALIDKPWCNPGWVGMMFLWVNNVLLSRDLILADRVRVVNNGLDSMVLKLKATAMDNGGMPSEQRLEVLYLKAGLPIFHEAQRTAAIGRAVGGIVPEVLAVHEDMMIQRDGGAIEDEAFDPEALIGTVLKMQRLSVNHVKELEAAGLRVMDANWLASNIDSILKHEVLDQFWKSHSDKEEREINKRLLDGLRSMGGWIQGAFRELAEMHLPNTVVHGDLGFQNIGCRAKNGGRDYCFFDWARSFVGHPLLDLHFILSHSEPISGVWINQDTAIGQFTEQWVPSFSHSEVESLLEASQMMYNMTQIHDYSQIYEQSNEKERLYLVRNMGEWIMDLLELMD